jgi:hypothetical protein
MARMANAACVSGSVLIETTSGAVLSSARSNAGDLETVDTRVRPRVAEAHCAEADNEDALRTSHETNDTRNA